MNDDRDLELLKKMKELPPAPPLDPSKAARQKERYLAKALSIRHSLHGSSHKSVNKLPIRKKEKISMFTKFATIATALVVLLAGAGAGTVYAAQDSLPNEPLYAVKIFSENASLTLAGDEANQFQLALEYINRRGDEIVALKAKGEPLAEPLMTRLQEHMAYSLQLAAGMEAPQMEAALNQFRNMIQKQEQKMLQAGQDEQKDPVLERARAMLQTNQGIAEAGLADPATFRNMAQSGSLYGQPDSPGPSGPAEEPPAKGDDTKQGPGDSGPAGNGKPSGQGGPGDPGETNNGSGQPGGNGSPGGQNGSPNGNSNGGNPVNSKSNKGGGLLYPTPTPTPTPSP